MTTAHKEGGLTVTKATIRVIHRSFMWFVCASTSTRLWVPTGTRTSRLSFNDLMRHRQSFPSSVVQWSTSHLASMSHCMSHCTRSMSPCKKNEINGFLHVRMLGTRPSAKKKRLKKKSSGKNLNHWSWSLGVPAALHETRHAEWKQRQGFNAGVILSDERGTTTHWICFRHKPLQWIEVDKNAHQRRHNDYTQQYLWSRLAVGGNSETTDGLRTDSPCNWRGLAQHRVQLVCTGSCWSASVWFHQWILSSLRDGQAVVVSYTSWCESGRWKTRRDDLSFARSVLRHQRCGTTTLDSHEGHVSSLWFLFESNGPDTVHIAKWWLWNHCSDVIQRWRCTVQLPT